MRIEDGMGLAFKRWQELTDSYARHIEAMRRNEAGAAVELGRIAKDIEKYESHFLELAENAARIH